MPQKMVTPAQRIQKILGELYAEFLKSPFVIPAGVAFVAGVYLLVLTYISGFCLSGLITPLAIIGIFWKFGFKDVKKLLLLGAVACVACSIVMTVYLPYSWSDLDDPLVESDDGTFTDGTVTPMYADISTAYNFTVTIHWTNLSDAGDVRLIVSGVGYFPEPEMNLSMIPIHNADPNSTVINYYLETEVANPMNVFYFGAPIDGSWTYVGTLGPVPGSLGGLIVWLTPTAFVSTFASVYPILALLLLMVWWTRRARKMRTEAYEKAVAEREKEREGVGKDEAKVPSLSKAMGLEADEGFVCSECGADVPAEAKVCPKCGEKFD